MKIKNLLFLVLLFSTRAQSEPLWLLNCYLNSDAVQNVWVSSYMGRLFLLTKPADGDSTSRALSFKEWDSRILVIADTPTLYGVLYKEDKQWFFKLKDTSGWSTTGNANCGEHSNDDI